MRSLFVALAVFLCMIGGVLAVLISDAAFRKQFEDARQSFVEATGERYRQDGQRSVAGVSGPAGTVAQNSQSAAVTPSLIDGASEPLPPNQQSSSPRKPTDVVAAKGLSLDIARIGLDGISVFAGRAQPFQKVRVRVGQDWLGATKADADGNWALVSERPISDPDGQVELAHGEPRAEPVAEAGGGEQTVTGGAASPRTAAKAIARPASETSRPVASSQPPIEVKVGEARPVSDVAEVNKKLISDLEGLVEEARSGQEAVAAEPQKVARAATASRDETGGGVRVRRIPIPIQFIYREAEFTEEGSEAVRLLLEYLKVSGRDAVRLSGHADERGSHDLNMELSRRRLEAVRDYLRTQGFSGRFELEPKGETEPFQGVDRATMPAEQLYQLDRRVELILEE